MSTPAQDAVSDKLFYSYKDLTARWGVTRQTVWKLVKEGRLRASHIKGSVRFTNAAVRAFEAKM